MKHTKPIFGPAGISRIFCVEARGARKEVSTKSEVEKVREIMEEVTRGDADDDNVGRKIIYDQRVKTLRPTLGNKDEDNDVTVVVRIEDIFVD